MAGQGLILEDPVSGGGGEGGKAAEREAKRRARKEEKERKRIAKKSGGGCGGGVRAAPAGSSSSGGGGDGGMAAGPGEAVRPRLIDIEVGVPPLPPPLMFPYLPHFYLTPPLLLLLLFILLLLPQVRSVDGFQGAEREAVIISLVRSNARGEVDDARPPCDHAPPTCLCLTARLLYFFSLASF